MISPGRGRAVWHLRAMREVKVLLLNLGPASAVDSNLRGILRSCDSSRLELHQESIEPGLADDLAGDISNILHRYHPDAILITLPSRLLMPARELIKTLANRSGASPVIVVTEDVQPHDLFDLLKLGVADFITTPLKASDVLPRFWRAVEQDPQESRVVHSLKQKIGLSRLVGKSSSFLAEVEKIPLVARCDASVLISGETGTGKELFARAIHYLSPRAGKPFVPISCGAIPLDLMENELFGHVQGAFTGASSSSPGLIQEAYGGTLFMDEIDCLPLPAQVKLLRFLQEREYKQLGSTRICNADVRVVAATNVELETVVNEGKFRRDLFYRLNIVPVTLPPLRDRKEDIPILARHFLAKYAFEFKKEVQDLTSGTVQKLMLHEWPGNVRELENAIERAVIFSKHPLIDYAEVVGSESNTRSAAQSFKYAKAAAVGQFERKYIQDLLIAYRGNISRAAKAAGKNRRAFWELIRRHRIDVQQFKSPKKQDVC